MKQAYYVSLLVFLFLGFTQQSYGQLKLSGEVRPRPEYQNGYKTLQNEDGKSNDFISQRTRINVDYKMESMKFKVSFQDIRTWGTTPQLNNSDAYLALHEAWGEVMFTPAFSLKLGRQELVYDDHRIFGSVGWAQQARSHDLGLFKYEKNFKLHLGIAYNQSKNENFTDYKKYYKTMQFVWFNKSYSNFNMSLFALNNGLQAYDTSTNLLTDDIRYSQTLGTFLKGNISIISLDGSFYYQMGKDRIDRSLSAYNIALNAGFKLSDAFSLKAGFEMLSGTDSYGVDAEINNSFSPFYGTNHKFNGFMDYFYVGNHMNSVGLNDYNFGAKWKNGKWFVSATAHYFMSNANLFDDEKSEVDASLGTELDLGIGYKFNDWINFTGGYSQMFATSSMEVLKGGNKDVTNNWAYLMITLKPTFLDTSK